MGKEIEHKYLVKDDSYIAMSESSHHIRQGYLCREPERTVRVRVRDNQGFLTVKGRTVGDTRSEFEYLIPYSDALEMLGMCQGNIIDKVRYLVRYERHIWEVDKFSSPREMTVAEIELPSSDTQYAIPPFIGENVTGDPSYFNSNL